MSKAYFSEQTFAFLRELKANNHREWFQDHKQRYENDVRKPFQRWLSELSERLPEVSPEFVASPKTVGGSLFRIHRDTRFSKDKTPYKTHAGAVIFHQDRSQPAPCFYLHIDPEGCFFGAGLYHPPPPTLRRIRDFLVDNPSAWIKARDQMLSEGLSFGGDSLTRPPRGYDPNHPLINDLKRKDLVVSAPLEPSLATSAEVLPWFLDRVRSAAPLNDYLCAALDLPF
ncbi:MAG: DUF2461 domain-containing protein [Xanthomonadales bacterium]|nr:DUF2461 domain-containing protein [Xanthomonadales bacterium]